MKAILLKKILLKAILLKAILLKAILLTALLGMSLIVACKQPSAPKEEPSDPKPKPTPKVYKQPVLDSIFADRMRPGELELFGRFDSASARVVIDSTTLTILSKDSTHILCTLPIIGRGSAGPITVQDSGGTSNSKLLSMWGIGYHFRYGQYLRSGHFNVISEDTIRFIARFEMNAFLTSGSDSVNFTLLNYNTIDSINQTPPEKLVTRHAAFVPKDSTIRFNVFAPELLFFNKDLTIQVRDRFYDVAWPYEATGEWWPTFTQFLPK